MLPLLLNLQFPRPEDGDLPPLRNVNTPPDMGPLWVKLASAGVRPTRQRLELADILFSAGDRHFTAEMIHGEARALRYPPSLGTIYNTLNQFVQNGLLREIALYDSKIWYDTNTGPHCHYYWGGYGGAVRHSRRTCANPQRARPARRQGDRDRCHRAGEGGRGPARMPDGAF